VCGLGLRARGAGSSAGRAGDLSERSMRCGSLCARRCRDCATPRSGTAARSTPPTTLSSQWIRPPSASLDANRKAGEARALCRRPHRPLFPRPLPERPEERGRDFAARVATAGEGTLPEIDLASPAGPVPRQHLGSMIVHGAGRFLQLICRDLSERKRMERELVQAEKLSTVACSPRASSMSSRRRFRTSRRISTRRRKTWPRSRRPTRPRLALRNRGRARGLAAGADDRARPADLRPRERREEERVRRERAVRMALRMAQHELKHRATVVTSSVKSPR